MESFLHYRPQTDSQVKETGLAPHGDALTIALNERVRGEDDVGIPQEKSHSLSDGGGAIDGVVVGLRDADPAPSAHAEQFLSLRQFCATSPSSRFLKCIQRNVAFKLPTLKIPLASDILCCYEFQPRTTSQI